MTFWVLAEDQQQISKSGGAMTYHAPTLPDIHKAISREHLKEWIRHIHSGSSPEFIQQETEKLWRLFSEVNKGDHLVLVHGESFSLGEITDGYHFEKESDKGNHLWAVRWIIENVPLSQYVPVRIALSTRWLTGMTESEARMLFRKHLTGKRVSGQSVMRWIMTILLISELIYFWPKR